MRRSAAIGLALTLAVAVATLFGVRYWYAPHYASDVAVDAAGSWGLNLLTFEGPMRSGNVVLGTEVAHWERRVGAAVVERVSYLRQDERLCWSVLQGQVWKDNGCIDTRPYEK
jgi:hypothetical protein